MYGYVGGGNTVMASRMPTCVLAEYVVYTEWPTRVDVGYSNSPHCGHMAEESSVTNCDQFCEGHPAQRTTCRPRQHELARREAVYHRCCSCYVRLRPRHTTPPGQGGCVPSLTGCMQPPVHRHTHLQSALTHILSPLPVAATCLR